MNAIEQLQIDLKKQYPDIKADLSVPNQYNGFWQLEITIPKGPDVNVQMKLVSNGWSLSILKLDDFGQGPDEAFSSIAELKARLDQLIKGD